MPPRNEECCEAAAQHAKDRDCIWRQPRTVEEAANRVEKPLECNAQKVAKCFSHLKPLRRSPNNTRKRPAGNFWTRNLSPLAFQVSLLLALVLIGNEDITFFSTTLGGSYDPHFLKLV